MDCCTADEDGVNCVSGGKEAYVFVQGIQVLESALPIEGIILSQQKASGAGYRAQNAAWEYNARQKKETALAASIPLVYKNVSFIVGDAHTLRFSLSTTV